MDYTPRAETIRQLAGAAYLPLVPAFLLLSRRYREVRLIRFHAYQAIGIDLAVVLVLLLSSLVSSTFGGLPGLGFLINMVVGLAITTTLLGATAISFYAAYMAYQGSFTSLPLLTEWAWLRVNGVAQAPKKRKRRPRPEDEIDWDELPIVAQPEETPEP